jgi:hypothetical protein
VNTTSNEDNRGSLSAKAIHNVQVYILSWSVIDIERLPWSDCQWIDGQPQHYEIGDRWAKVLDLLFEHGPQAGQEDRAAPDWLDLEPILVPALTPQQEFADGFLRAVRRLTQRAGYLANYAPKVTKELAVLELRYRERVLETAALPRDDQQRWQDLPEVMPAERETLGCQAT